MTSLPDAPLVAHLLYPTQAAPPDMADLVARLNDDLARVQLVLRNQGIDRSGAHVFAHPLVTLHIRPVAAPCPASDLAPAMAAPFLAMKSPDLAARAARHTHHLELRVTCTANPDATDGALPWPMQLVVLHRALLALVRDEADVVVHMALSDMLFSRAEVLDTAEMTLPIPLCLYPLPVAQADVPTIAGVLPPLGLIALGAERFCDRPVMLMPSLLPLRDGLTLLGAILRDHAGGVFPMTDGAHLNNPGHGGIFVRHAPADDSAPMGRILIGLADWPDPTAPPPRPVGISELAPEQARATTSPPQGMIGRIAGGIGRFAASPNGMITIAGIAAYLLISHMAGQWFDSQSEMVRAATAPRN